MYSILNCTSTMRLSRALLMYLMGALFLFFEMTIQVSPSVMAFQLMQDLHMTAFGLGIMSGCYFYTYTAMQIPAGILFDHFNARLVIVTSVLICTIGIAALGFSSNIYFACIARMFMGFGSAFAFVSVLVLTSDLFQAKYFATITGVTQTLAALGAMSGQLPISLMVQNMGWRYSVFIFTVIGLLIALIIYFFLKYERSPRCITLNKSENFAQSLKIIAMNKQTWFIALYACLLWAPMSAFTSLWGVPFLIIVDKLSHSSAAFLCSLMWLGLAVASPLLGFISTYYKKRKIALALSALLGVISFGLILWVKFPVVTLSIFLFIAGAACAGQALSFTLVKENNSRLVAATALAINNMAVVISGALFQPFIGWLLKAKDLTHVFQFRSALSVIFMAYVLGFIIAMFFINESKTT